MNRPHFRRHPRTADPEPYTRLDRLDGLPGRTRYDVEWPDLIAAEWPSGHQYPASDWLDDVPGGDLAAMAAPADWPEFSGWGEYDIGPWPGHLVARVIDADAEVDLPMVRAAVTTYDLGLPVPLRSDPPIYRQALAGHAGAVTR